MSQFVTDNELRAILARCQEVPVREIDTRHPKMSKRTFWLWALVGALLPWRVLLPAVATLAAARSYQKDNE